MTQHDTGTQFRGEIDASIMHAQAKLTRVTHKTDTRPTLVRDDGQPKLVTKAKPGQDLS